MALPTVIILAGPSGAGKSTLTKLLLSEFPGQFGFSISHTSRQPRGQEVDGKDYHFTTKEWMIAQGDDAFMERAEYSGNMYGTTWKVIEDIIQSGKRCLMDIDMQGVKNVKALVAQNDRWNRIISLPPRYIFIKPTPGSIDDDIAVLEARIRGRTAETGEVVDEKFESSLAKRLAAARTELDYASVPGVYDYIIVNEKKEAAYEDLKRAIFAESV